MYLPGSALHGSGAGSCVGRASAAIRGHGTPEAMERVLFGNSRIPGRVAWLKPLSAALSIGTGGPFGAEGPIIVTGAAFGSLVGQRIPMSDDERRTILAAGAGAGMAATFGAPVSAVLLAIELLHQGFPVIDDAGTLVGVVTLRDLRPGAPRARVRDRIRGAPAVVFDHASLREAADHMRALGIGRLAVVRAAAPRVVVGMLTRSDLVGAMG